MKALKVSIGGESILVFRNQKMKGQMLLKQEKSFEAIDITGNQVVITPAACQEIQQDLSYFIHERNAEHEDGKIREWEWKNSHRFFDVCWDSISGILTLATKHNLGDDARIECEWVDVQTNLKNTTI